MVDALIAEPRIENSEPSRLQVIVDPPAAGAWNMAVDDALLAAAARENVVTLRLYQWSEPTLSLGYFQCYADRHQHAGSRNAAVVRRPSGGGAILHDQELTYSLTVPASHPWARDTERLYYTVHQAIASLVLRLLGPRGPEWSLELRKSGSNLPPHQEPFLCFQRTAPGDVVITRRHGSTPSPPWKIVGSAQRRRGAVLQHGSILLRSSRAAPELPGLCDVTGADLTPETFLAEMPEVVAKLLEVEAERSVLSSDAQLAASQIARDKYFTSRWTERR